MIRLDTFRALHEHDHQLAAYCATCERWAVLDLERLIAEGRGEYVFVGKKPRVRSLYDWTQRPFGQGSLLISLSCSRTLPSGCGWNPPSTC